MARSWTSEELEYLRDNYELMGLMRVSNVLERSVDAVSAQAQRLRLVARNSTVEEDEALKAAILAGDSESTIAELTGRAPKFVRERAKAMDLWDRLRENRSGVYVAGEVATIHAMAAAGSTAEEIASVLERTSIAVRCYCRRNSIALVDARVKAADRLGKRGRTNTRAAPAPPYNAAELAILRSAVEKRQTATELVDGGMLPGRTPKGVYLKARQLGLDVPQVRHSKSDGK